MFCADQEQSSDIVFLSLSSVRHKLLP